MWASPKRDPHPCEAVKYIASGDLFVPPCSFGRVRSFAKRPHHQEVTWPKTYNKREYKSTYISYISKGNFKRIHISLVQSLNCVWFSVTPWTAAHQASLSITHFRSLFKLTSIESVMPSNHVILCRSLLLPSVFPSIRVFSNESVLCIKWPKYCSFSFSISLSNEYEYSGLISIRKLTGWISL